MNKAVLSVCLLAVSSMTLFAQNPRIVHTKEKSSIHVSPQESPQSLKPIYSNLKSKPDLYNDTYGWVISRAESVALPFTPKSYSHVSQVRVPVKYLAGDNQVNVSIYGGSGDVPEILLAGPVTVANLPAAGTCCALAIATFRRLPQGPELGTGWLSAVLLAEPAAISRAFGTRLPRSFR